MNELPAEIDSEHDSQMEVSMLRFADILAAKIAAAKPVKSVPLQELYESYMDLHVRLKCKSWRNLERMYACYLTHWADRQVKDITRLDVEKLFAELSVNIGKVTACRVIQFLRPMFNHGIRTGLIDCPNPITGFKVYRLEPRTRFLERSEIEKLFAAINKLRYAKTRDFLYLCLFTGARRGNVAAMRWEDVSLERATWNIPNTKNGTSQLLPLSTAALAILHKRYASRKENAVWVFPSDRSPCGHLTKPDGAWKAILEQTGLQNLRMHDLRRTLASWEAMTGANISVIAASLNHKDLKSTQIYARLNTDPVRSAMNKAIDAMTCNVAEFCTGVRNNA